MPEKSRDDRMRAAMSAVCDQIHALHRDIEPELLARPDGPNAVVAARLATVSFVALSMGFNALDPNFYVLLAQQMQWQHLASCPCKECHKARDLNGLPHPPVESDADQ